MEKRRDATVCFIIQNEKVLLAKINYPEGFTKWNGIGGFAKDGESKEEALVREIKEEIDVSLNKDDVIKVYETDLYPKINLHVFICRDLHDQKPIIIDPTISELKWFDFNELPFDEMWEGNSDWLPQLLRI